MMAHGFVGDLGPIPSAREQAERTIPRTVVGGRRGKPLSEQGAGRVELVLDSLSLERSGDDVGLHPATAELTGDALPAPTIEPPAVLDEPPREVDIVEVTGRRDLLERLRRCAWFHSSALEQGVHLGHRMGAARERPPDQLKRPAAPRLLVTGRRRVLGHLWPSASRALRPPG